MEKSVIVAGFGGQGVMLIGQLIGLCACESSMAATYYPSYGPEQRGGTANCTVVVADEDVSFPIPGKCDVFVPMNQASLEKHQDALLPGGIMILDSATAKGAKCREDVTILELPVTELASKAGSPRTANMVILGALCMKLNMFTLDSVEKVVHIKLGKKPDLLPLNLAALKAGWDYAKNN